MPKPFDATLKHLIERYPIDWLRLIDAEPSGPVSVVDADLSAITAAADKVIRIDDDQTPWLLHLEIQASNDARLPERMHYYNTLLAYRHQLPVRTVAVLLRQSADGGNVTGIWERGLPNGQKCTRFEYETLRVWAMPADKLLKEGPGVLPLAILADDAQSRLSGIIRETAQQSASMADHETEELLTAEFVLAGLRYAPNITQVLFHGVRAMRESSTYMLILEEGAVEYARKAIFMLGTKTLGEPDPRIRQTIESLSDITRLDAMLERVIGAKTWDEIVQETE